MASNLSKYSAWAIALFCGTAAYILYRRGRQSNPPSLLNNNSMGKSYYPEYDYLRYNRLTMGYRNNNPVNIVYNPGNKWLGQIGKDPNGNKAQFIDLVHGYRAALVLLRGKGYIGNGLNTIEKIIYKFAPASDGNDPESYIANVSRMTGIPRNQVISPNDKDALTSIVYAMSISENGYKDLDKRDIRSTYGLPDMEIINKAWNIM